MIYCYGCKRKLHESAKVCPGCGAVQKGLDIVPEGVKFSKWGLFWFNGFYLFYKGYVISGIIALVVSYLTMGLFGFVLPFIAESMVNGIGRK